MKAFLFVAVACVCLVALPCGMASAVIVDHFASTPFFNLTVTPGTLFASQTGDAITGAATTLTSNVRSESLQLVISDVNSEASAVHNPTTNTNVDYSNRTGTSSTFILQYTFAAADFTDGGASSNVYIILTAGDLSGATMKCTLTDGTTTSTVSVFQPAGPTIDLFAFSSFNPLLNLNAITGITYELDSVLAQDAEFDAIQTGGNIPEPMTMAGLIMGLGSLSYYVRRRRAV